MTSDLQLFQLTFDIKTWAQTLLTLLCSAHPGSCAKPWVWCLALHFRDLRSRYVSLVPQGRRGSCDQCSPTPKMVFLLFSLYFLSVVAVSVTQIIPLKGINPRRTTEFSEVIMYFSFCFYFHKLSRQLQQGQNYVFNRAAGMWDLKNIPQSSHEPSQLFVWRA